MKMIGGEQAFKADKLYSRITDSGRSSLRLIIKSGLQKKRFLVPDFLCGSILDVLNDMRVKHAFYRVKKDLSLDYSSIARQKYDVLYVIDYFGKRQGIPPGIEQKKIIIQDSVFSPEVVRPSGVEQWAGFNSFRKISPLADGSILRSTFELSEEMDRSNEAGFVELKYRAKEIKHAYLSQGKYSERVYLSLFDKAEKMLGRQKAIHRISDKSLLCLITDLYKRLGLECQKRSENRAALDRYLKEFAIPVSSKFGSFYALNVDDRDGLRRYLAGKKIFLPVHWPKPLGLANDLYDRIISIPLDTRYGCADMTRIAGAILSYYRPKSIRGKA